MNERQNAILLQVAQALGLEKEPGVGPGAVRENGLVAGPDSLQLNLEELLLRLEGPTGVTLLEESGLSELLLKELEGRMEQVLKN